MRLSRIALLLILLCLLSTVARATPAHLWSHSYGDLDDQFIDACVADPFGNVVICGSFYGTINITTPFTSFGRRDVIVAKFAPNGTPMWSSRIGFTSVDTGWSACSDNVGNTIVVGSVGPDPNVRNAFIARYTPAGAQQWMKTFVSSDSLSYCEVVATDATKHIHVAGRFNGNINLGGSTLVAQASDDIFLAEFDAAGNHLWSKSFTAGGTIGELGGIAVDANGQPVLFGSFGGSVNFGGGALNPVATYDLFLVKFSESGAFLWNKRFGLNGNHIARDLAIGDSGRMAITGEAWGDLDFGGGLRPEITGPDIFLAVLNSNGSHVWSTIFGAGDREAGTSVSFASNGDVLLSAWTHGTDPFSFGGASFSGQANYQDLLVARFFQANGNHRWSTKYSGPDGFTLGYVGETDGQVFLGGGMGSTTDFGGGPLPNPGGEQIFVARFADALTGVTPAVAPRAALLQNTPNPFNPSTTIRYTLSSPGRVTIEIADASGAMVARVDQGVQPAGTHSATWNGRDSRGRAVASGVYFYRIAGMPGVPARKMVLLK